ncbi:MAG TPA: amidohydrolase family protein [Candidatus Binataceae bacterium]|nr:amidohydrolase family protein [Candidatus Binataceae bacterium]
MPLDLIIRDAMVIDGSGAPRFGADVGIDGGKIVAVGKVQDAAREVIDAHGAVVSPGFIDGHTHMDAQVFWDALGTCSCWHGITSVVMGNCGFTLAPCRESEKHLAIRNLERAEDISPQAMEAGIRWSWEDFPQYLDAVDRLPKGINYAAYMGHSALRTYVMGERAFSQQAGADDLEAMKREVRKAIRAGAIGFTTSRSSAHQTPQGLPVASRLASWEEVRQLVGVMGELGAGVFELANEDMRDPERVPEYQERLKRLALDTGVPVTFGVFSAKGLPPNNWKTVLATIDATVAAGGRMFGQAHTRSLSVLFSFETVTPFDRLPLWSEIRKRPLAEQEAALRDPNLRHKLVEAVRNRTYDPDAGVGAEVRDANFKRIFVLDKPMPPYRCVADLANELNQDPVDVIIDLALARHMKQFFLQTIANENQDEVLGMIRHPLTVPTFSDSGAHVSQLMDSSLQTHLLSYWVREKQALTLEDAVRRLTSAPAGHWGLTGRGLLREGYAADVIIFDPDTIGPQMPELVYDLPAGARRLKQKADGLLATIVNGQVLLRNNEHTGAEPGQLLRGPLARAAQ